MSITPDSFRAAVLKLILRHKHFASASGGSYQRKARPCFVTKADRQGFWAAPLCGARELSDGLYGPRNNMEMGSWAPVDFRDPSVPIPVHPSANVAPFVLPLVRTPEDKIMQVKPCYIWTKSPGEYVLYREFREWDIQMARKDKPVYLDAFFDLDLERILQLRLQHASYDGE